MIITKVYDDNTFLEFLENFKKSSKKIALDIEATSLDWFSGEILSIQIAFLLDGVVRVYVFLPEFKNKFGLVYKLIAKLAKQIIGHNLKFDIKFLKYKFGEEILGDLFDTMLAHRLTCVGYDNCPVFVSLEDLYKKYLDIELDKSVRETFENSSSEVSFTEDQIHYAAMDVAYLFHLRDILVEKLEEINHYKIFDLEMKVLKVVIDMELNGINLDKDKFLALASDNLNKALETASEIREKIRDRILEKYDGKTLYEVFISLRIPVKTKKLRRSLEAVTVNEKSYDTTIQILFDHLNLNSIPQTKSIFSELMRVELPSTNKKDLELLLLSGDLNDEQSWLVRKILEMRELYKRYSTYGEKFIKDHLYPDGKIHASFHQLGTTTGRFSSSNPNMQNIPREKEYRHCFVASPGNKIITADYSQMELRLMAVVSREKKIIEAYKKDPNADLHSLTASLVFDKPIEEVGKGTEERQIAKSVNFAIIYGTSARGLSYNLGIPLEKAKFILKRFMEAYPNLAYFMQRVRNLVWEKGYSKTPYGRKRFFTKKRSFRDHRDLQRLRSKIEREGLNHIIQGGSADVVKLAMIRLYEENPFGRDKFKILLQVHDEIVIEVAEEIAEEAKEFVEKIMDEEFQKFLGDVPAVVGIDVKPYWEK